jgi:hypothetical protein
MAKIDTSKDFTKYVGSLKKAKILIRSLLNKDENMRFTERRYGRIIDSAWGTSESFEWSYNAMWKTVSVTYTDGREKPEEKEYPEMYVVWIEGIEPKNGEKIVSLDRYNHEYTLSMTQAMRVLPEHKEMVKSLLREQGVSKWALENCFARVNYAPKGTIFNPDKL